MIEGVPDHLTHGPKGPPDTIDVTVTREGWRRRVRSGGLRQGVMVRHDGPHTRRVCPTQRINPLTPPVLPLFPGSVQVQQRGRVVVLGLRLLVGVVTVDDSSRREHVPTHPTEGPGCSR